jgi:hypothetical protein
MKVGINLVGIAYDDQGNLQGRDWYLSYARVYQRIIECWSDMGHDVSVYLTTYKYSLNRDANYDTETIVSWYKAKKYQFLDKIGRSTMDPWDKYGTNQISTHKKSLELLRGEDIDLVVSSRFDIIFNHNITEYNIDYNKFNVLFKEKENWEEKTQIPEKNNELGPALLTSDVLFIYPYNMLEDVIGICDEKIQWCQSVDHPIITMHDMYRRILHKKGEEFVNLMTNDTCFSYNHKTNTHYSVIRRPNYLM